MNAKHNNSTHAILLASEMWKPVYTKMEFKEFADLIIQFLQGLSVTLC